jgi:hypothetical protein
LTGRKVPDRRRDPIRSDPIAIRDRRQPTLYWPRLADGTSSKPSPKKIPASIPPLIDVWFIFFSLFRDKLKPICNSVLGCLLLLHLTGAAHGRAIA